MAPREDVVSSAVAFLQDPSVASSALDKRIAFLRSKNLTQEEIDISLARAGNEPLSANTPPPPPPPHQFRPAQQPAPGYGYGYGYDGYPPPWTQQPPEPPRRDWRDWFIMATVTTSLGYGLYTIAQRYVLPYLQPPTPPQLTQDKASIDASFAKAFALLDQLTTDTTALKTSEETRTAKLDTALKDTETLLVDLKAANLRRESENTLLASQVASLRDLVPKSLEQWKAGNDGRLDELAADVAGLKKLLENRVGRSSQQQQQQQQSPGYAAANSNPGAVAAEGQQQQRGQKNGQAQTKGNGAVSGAEGAGDSYNPTSSSSSLSAAAAGPAKETSPLRRGGPTGPGAGGKAAIPAWQMAAAANKSSGGSSGSGSGNGFANGGGAGASEAASESR